MSEAKRKSDDEEKRKQAGILSDKPKRPMSAFFIWLASAQDQIKADNPKLSASAIARKAGEIWRVMDKTEWQRKEAKALEKYNKGLEAYNERRAGYQQTLPTTVKLELNKPEIKEEHDENLNPNDNDEPLDKKPRLDNEGENENILLTNKPCDKNPQSDKESGERENKPSTKRQLKDVLKSIKEQIQSEIIKDIVVGSVEAESWQRRCEIVPEVYIDLLDPDTSELPLTTLPFGYKTETLIDKNVRDCKEVSLAQCDRELRKLAQRIVGSKYCEPHKLVVYEEGGHFEQHTDTSEKDLSESLVLHLPTDCKGGDLMFNSWNPSQHYAPNVINYTLFSINHPHRVTRVTKGKRISLLFKVFDVQTEKGCKKSIDGEYCNSIIKVPKMYKNILFTYPNKDVMMELFSKSKLDFIVVYYDYNTLEPEEVYSEVVFDDLSDGMSDTDDFTNFTKGATRYIVNDVVNLGLPIVETEGFTYYARLLCNEGQSVFGKLSYLTGWLVNPEPDEEDSSSI